jgi:hypothetical protein
MENNKMRKEALLGQWTISFEDGSVKPAEYVTMYLGNLD